MNDLSSSRLRRRLVRRIVLRLGAGVLLLLALGGPTPGYIGSCSTSGPRVADAAQFCVDKQSAICAREARAGLLDGPMYNMCAAAIEGMCMGRTWANGCAPSPEATGACISALRDADRITTPTNVISECYEESLCGVAPLVSPDPDGI